MKVMKENHIRKVQKSKERKVKHRKKANFDVNLVPSVEASSTTGIGTFSSSTTVELSTLSTVLTVLLRNF